MPISGAGSGDAAAADAGPRRVGTRRRRVFASLANRNYRRYFAGQAVSLAGTWMQSIAQSWLVFQLTGSGTMLGLVIAVQTLPVLLLTPTPASSSTAPTSGSCCWAPSPRRRCSHSVSGR